MQPYKLYKHENCTDAAILPIKFPLFIPEKKGYKIRVQWWNVVNKPFFMDAVETVFINSEDYRKWKLLNA